MIPRIYNFQYLKYKIIPLFLTLSLSKESIDKKIYIILTSPHKKTLILICCPFFFFFLNIFLNIKNASHSFSFSKRITCLPEITFEPKPTALHILLCPISKLLLCFQITVKLQSTIFAISFSVFLVSLL